MQQTSHLWVPMQYPFVGWVFQGSKSNDLVASVPFTILWIICSVFFTAFFVTTTRANLSSTFYTNIEEASTYTTFRHDWCVQLRDINPFGMNNPSTNQFGCVERGYPKPHPTGRSRWKGFQWVCLFATVECVYEHKGVPRIQTSLSLTMFIRSSYEFMNS